MPHNLCLHSALVQSRSIDRKRHDKIREANFYFAVESVLSLAVSFFINLCVIAVFAKGFFVGDGVSTGIGLEDAGDDLGARYGNAARIIWAIGLLAAGQASTMTGTYAGQFVMQGFLNLKLAPWSRTLLTRSVAIVPSLIVALSFTSNLDKLDEWLNVMQSIQLPFAVLPLIIFSRNPAIVGQFRLSKKTQALAWAIACLVVTINLYLLFHFVSQNLPNHWLTYLLTVLFSLTYILLLCYIGLKDIGAELYSWWRFYRSTEYQPAELSTEPTTTSSLN